MVFLDLQNSGLFPFTFRKSEAINCVFDPARKRANFELRAKERANSSVTKYHIIEPKNIDCPAFVRIRRINYNLFSIYRICFIVDVVTIGDY